MNSNMAFDYFIAFLSGRPINAEGAAQQIVGNIGKITGSKVYRFK
jgi:hypothetical protein